MRAHCKHKRQRPTANAEHVAELVEANLYLVEATLYALRVPPHSDLAALKSAGFAGLQEAARNFDPARGYSFKSFAIRTLRFRLRDECRKLGSLSRVALQVKKKLDGVEGDLTQRLSREPTAEEMAEALGVSLAKFAKMSAAARGETHVSIDDDPFEEGAATFHDVIPEVNSALEREDAETVLGYVRQAVDAMPAGIEKSIIVQSYFHGTPLAKIACEQGLTESRISQIRQDGTRKLRRLFVAIVRRDGQPSFALPRGFGGPRK